MKWNEMDEMSVEKWWNEVYGRGKREKPRENLPRSRFVHHETHMEGPRRELGTPAVILFEAKPNSFQMNVAVKYIVLVSQG